MAERPAPPPTDTAQVLARLEARVMPELMLPEPVARDVAEGTGRVLSAIVQQEKSGYAVRPDAPDAVVFLLRSARLPGTAIRSFLERDDVKGNQPLLMEAALGKIVPLLHIDELSEDDDAVDEATYDVGAHLPAFRQWANRPDNPVIAPIRGQLLAQADGRHIRNVLVVDDAASTGETRRFTAPEVLRAIFGKDLVIADDVLFSSFSGWEYNIIDASFGELDAVQRHILHEMIKGSVDERVIRREIQFLKDAGLKTALEETLSVQHTLGTEPYPLIPLSNRSSLDLLEYHSQLYHPDKQSERPLERLIERFGEQDILALPQKAEALFRQVADRVEIPKAKGV